MVHEGGQHINSSTVKTAPKNEGGEGEANQDSNSKLTQSDTNLTNPLALLPELPTGDPIKDSEIKSL